MTEPRQAELRIAVLQADLRRGPLPVEQQAELLELAGGLCRALTSAHAAAAEATAWQTLTTRAIEAITRSSEATTRAATQADKIDAYLASLAASSERWSKAALAIAHPWIIGLVLLIVGGVLGVFVVQPIAVNLPGIESRIEGGP